MIYPALRKYYIYAIKIILGRVISIITMSAIGLCMNKLIEAVLFIAFFSVLRKYIGGYHAHSFLAVMLSQCQYFLLFCILAIGLGRILEL